VERVQDFGRTLERDAEYSFRSSREQMAPREWGATKAQFAVVFDDRFEVSR
jgi:hypothetical protein